jgi:polysaccharide biosynthesis protein PslH
MSVAGESSPIGGSRSGGNGAPSILAVTSEVPWPLNTGGHLRTFHLLHSLVRWSRVRLVVPMRAGQESAIEALECRGIEVDPVIVPARTFSKEALRVVSAVAAREPYVFYRRHDHRAVRTTLRNQIEREAPDVLYLDHLDSFLYKPPFPSLPCVIDMHNVYSMLTRRIAQERKIWSRPYMIRETGQLARLERRAAGTAESLMAVSAEDRDHFVSLGGRSVHLVPNGVDCFAYESLPIGRRSSAPIILFVGMMCWGPNIAAVQFLATEVLPRLRHWQPATRLQIVGRDPAPEVRALGRLPGVEITGAVPDVIPYLRDAKLLAVPLEAGGGTRLKILEAFAGGLPVVSSPVGCEGLEVEAGRHLVITSRERFAEGLAAVLRDDSVGECLAARARALVREVYDWSVVGEAARCAVETAIETPGRRFVGSA